MSTQEKRPTIGRDNNHALIMLIFRYILGLCGCVLICWLLLCVLAKLMCSIDIPLGWIVPLTTCCSSAAILVGAFLFLKKMGKNGAVWGGLLAFGCWVILCLGGLVQGEIFTDLTLLKLLAFVCAGMIGGITGVLLYEKKKKSMRR